MFGTQVSRSRGSSGPSRRCKFIVSPLYLGLPRRSTNFCYVWFNEVNSSVGIVPKACSVASNPEERNVALLYRIAKESHHVLEGRNATKPAYCVLIHGQCFREQHQIVDG